MTKKLATLVAMLACCVFGALAQRVATTPVTDVQTGVYMLRMKSDRIPGTDGAWVYYKDSHAYGESDNTALKVVTENPLSEDHYNYLWRVVRKDDGKSPYRVSQLILIGLRLRAERNHFTEAMTTNGFQMTSR